ncbi:MAG: nucleotide exchange factor GrpE [Clostridia bacterium]|jgi:molecular chaperone GrpE|nr:nucleotide exchange factor GrpE [Clostridia bacterium]
MEEKVETTKKPTIKALSAENEQLKQEIETLKGEVAKTKDSWLRCAADFENFKKRNQDTRINAYKEGKFDIVKKILVVGDTLDRALSMDLDDKTKDGLKMIVRSFSETLESEGITEINPVGEKFDPNTQEAVMQVPKSDGEEEGTVKQVFLKGYKQGDKVIRYAQVVVIG